MKNREIRQLTFNEEKCLLELLRKVCCEDNGSSRCVVFPYLHLAEEPFAEIVTYLHSIGITKTCVIKVNIGSAGCVQSYQERNVYESTDDYGVEYLADIYAYGYVVQIMEYVNGIELAEQAFEWIDNGDYIFDREFEFFKEAYGYNCNEDLTDEQIEEIEKWMKDDRELAFDTFDAITYLCDCMVGYTGDAYQVGLSEDGKVKAYDFGYFSNSTHKECCSNYSYEVTCGFDVYVDRILDELFAEDDDMNTATAAEILNSIAREVGEQY